MKIEGDAKLLRIFVGESEKFHKIPVYEKLVQEARKKGLAGATVLKGVMGFGKHSIIHTSKILALSEDLPLVIEIVDETLKIEEFIKVVDQLFEEGSCKGLITVEKVHVIKY